MTETNRAILINLGLGMQHRGALTGAESNRFVIPSCHHPRYDIGPGPGAASITLSG